MLTKVNRGVLVMFDRERNRLIAVGETLHGSQWKRPLARDLGVTESTVRGWTSGRRAPPDDLEQRLADLLKGCGHSPRKSLQTGQIAERAYRNARAAYAARTARAHAICVCSITARTPSASAANTRRAASINDRCWRAAGARACPARPRLCRAA
jgi:hypothetical protein